MALNVGINGFGRIGRIIFRTSLQNSSLKVSAINDPAVDIDYICYLIKFDSTHGKFTGTVERCDNKIIVDGNKISIFREKLPTNIPWQIADVQYVIETSGLFTNMEKASGHLASDGVKRVIVTAPSLDLPMLVLGVNDDVLNCGHKVISCASSTLYCLAPIVDILDKHYGVSEGFITSIHAMTPSLKPLDGLCLKGKHWRDHRSIHQNIIPASTGACRALGKIIPQVKDKMTGLAFRVPIVNVSVLDLTIRLKTNTTMEEVIRRVENASKGHMKNIIKTSNEQAVSSDFIGDNYSCILDTNSSLQLTPDFFKLICWYENEYSYACRAIDSIFFLETQYQREWQSKMSYIRSTPTPSFIHQSEFHKKMLYHQVCSYDCNSSSRSSPLSSTSHSGLKSPKRPLLPNKHVSCRNFEPKQLRGCRESKKKNEVFKIWNDDEEAVKTRMRHNRSSFFHSCVSIPPQIKDNAYVKTQERLEEVKREFSKMASMTETLLKKSQHSKIKIGLPVEPSTDEAGDTNIKNLQMCDQPLVNGGHCFAINNVVKVVHEDNINNKSITVNNDLFKHVLNHKISVELNNNKEVELPGSPKRNENGEISRQTLKNSNDSHIMQTLGNDYFKLSNILTNNLQNKNNVISTEKKEKNKSDNAYDKFNFHTKTPKIYIPPACIDIKGNTEEPSTSVPNQGASLANESQDRNERDLSDGEDTNRQHTENIPHAKHGHKDRNLQKRLEGILKKIEGDANVISENPSTCISPNSTINNRNTKNKEDIYDKLDSVSATDSENSFHMNERKSQVINITDLTNSLEDLERLDKICKIIEISDDLSDQLFSTLNNNDRKELKNKKWSFKDLCEKIKLDDFCNKIFSKTNI